MALVTYVVIAYGLMPVYWKAYVARHLAIDAAPNLTLTAAGLPGDPINVALIGSEEEIIRTMKAAKWTLAVRLGVRADLRIVEDTVLDRPDPGAPVSNLYLFGRREDLAFEQEVGRSPRQRHHVRFWSIQDAGAGGRPVWLGAAVYDSGVTISRTTGQVTHAIAPNLDDERAFLFDSLKQTGALLQSSAVDGYHQVTTGKNGDGNGWRTDGRLFVGVLAPR